VHDNVVCFLLLLFSLTVSFKICYYCCCCCCCDCGGGGGGDGGGGGSGGPEQRFLYSNLPQAGRFGAQTRVEARNFILSTPVQISPGPTLPPV